MIHLGHGYDVQLRGYYAWKKYVTTLIRFKHINSAFHSEAGIYLCGAKFHQMRYYIYMFNDKAKIIFVIGKSVAFYMGVITIRNQKFPVHMYNKDNTNKYIVDFLIFDDAKYDLIFHIYV